MASKKQVFIPYGTFDKSKLTLATPKTTKSKVGNSTCNSQYFYEDDDGEKISNIYIEFPSKKLFGISPTYPYGLDVKKQCPEEINGFQISYPLTSLETIESPTEEEQYIIDIFDAAYELAWEMLVEECEKDKPAVPSIAYNSFQGARDRKGNYNKVKAIKPIYEHPNKPIEKGQDEHHPREKDYTKPKRVYIKLNTFGKGFDGPNKLKCFTKISGPGNKPVIVSRFGGISNYEAKLCETHPVIQLSRVFWGAHGTSPCGGSVNIRVSEMNITPVSKEGGNRFLAPNTAPEEDEDESHSSFLKPTQESEELDFDKTVDIMEDLQGSKDEVKPAKKDVKPKEAEKKEEKKLKKRKINK